MLTEKYKEKFIEKYDKEANKGQIIRNIIETEIETGIELLKWDDAEKVVFLKKSHSVSVQSLSMSMIILRKFANFICEKEHLAKREYIMEDGIYIQLIDRKQLASITLSYEQYVCIKDQLDIGEYGQKINVRDKLIFCLAWSGLTNTEIRSVKEKDIEFVMNDKGWEVALIKLDNKTIKIEDSEIVNDIKVCLAETYNIRTAKDGRTKKTFYRDSEYLIKPINVGRPATKTYLENPHLALQRIFRTGEIKCEGISVEELTLADIRRSRLIYLLAPQNAEFFNFETIAETYNFRSSEYLRWYSDLAKEKYGVE